MLSSSSGKDFSKSFSETFARGSNLFAIIHKRVRPSGARCQVVLESINRGEAVGYAAENKGRGLW
jgi:hypothetical protein